MKRTDRVIGAIFGGIAMIILILDTESAFRGAAEGLELCIRSVIPALFPFLICSTYLTGNISAFRVPFLRPIGKLCHVPQGAEGILLTGLLGGYPTGAQAVAQAWANGYLGADDAHRMLGFVSNAGPAFLFGILAPFFTGPDKIWFIWFIHILSALSVGILLPGCAEESIQIPKNDSLSFPNALTQSVRTMGLICGWVILFRMLITLMEHWLLWILPLHWRASICGLLELTNGCVALSSIDQEHLRFLLASVLLGNGGLCVWMQTVSVTGKLGTGWYFPGKALQAGISALLCGIMVPILYPGTRLPWLIPVSLIFCVATVVSFRFRKNNSSNFQLQGV